MLSSIQMTPESGVLVYDFLDKPLPVIGWCVEQIEDETILYPLVLAEGKVQSFKEDNLRFRLVGLSQAWFNAVNAHNAKVHAPSPMPRA